MKANVGRKLQSVKARHKVLYIPTTYQGIATLQERENLVARLDRHPILAHGAYLIPEKLPIIVQTFFSKLTSGMLHQDFVLFTAILAIPSL